MGIIWDVMEAVLDLLVVTCGSAEALRNGELPSRLFLFMKLRGYEKGISDAEANWQEFRLGPNAQGGASLAHQT